MSYWKFDPEVFTKKYPFIRNPQYPIRVPPKEWPDMKLIGKAMVKGWAVPCRYWPAVRGGGSFRYRFSFVFPGISDVEYGLILQIMKQEEKC